MCILHIVFCTVCKYVLSICKLLLFFFFCTVWSTLIRISLTKALVLCWCDNKSDLIWWFTHHSREMQEIFRCTHNNKRQYFIAPFVISVRTVCKRNASIFDDRFCPVLSYLTAAVVGCLSGSRYAITFLIWSYVLCRFWHPTSQRWWYFKLLK